MFMRTITEAAVQDTLEHTEEQLHKYRYLFVLEGILFIATGIFAIVLPSMAVLAVQLLLTSALIASGVVQAALFFKSGPGRWWTLLSGLLSVAVGIFIFSNPLISMLTLVMLIGFFLISKGILECVLAFKLRPVHHWGWMLTSGIATIIMGILVFVGFPAFGILFLAVTVGINLILYGAAILSLLWHLRKESSDKLAYH